MIKRLFVKLYSFFIDKIVPVFGRVFVWRNKYCNVIYYHDVVDDCGGTCMYINVDKFKDQMKSLKEQGFEFLRFDDFSNKENTRFKKKRVLVSFDDGWLSNYSKIFEFMRENNIKYNIFLTVGKIGVDNDYLTWEMVRKMHSSGLVGFGAHTYSHPDMSDIDNINWEIEVEKANDVFQSELGYSPVDFCYPFGYYSEESNKKLLEKTIYQRIYTSKSCYSQLKEDKILFGRTGIQGEDGHNKFINIAYGYYNIKDFFIKVFYSPLLFVYHIVKHQSKQ